MHDCIFDPLPGESPTVVTCRVRVYVQWLFVRYSCWSDVHGRRWVFLVVPQMTSTVNLLTVKMSSEVSSFHHSLSHPLVVRENLIMPTISSVSHCLLRNSAIRNVGIQCWGQLERPNFAPLPLPNPWISLDTVSIISLSPPWQSMYRIWLAVTLPSWLCACNVEFLLTYPSIRFFVGATGPAFSGRLMPSVTVWTSRRLSWLLQLRTVGGSLGLLVWPL